MSDEVGKISGTRSGVAANDFVKAPNSQPLLEPGKKNLVQSTYLGNAYGDHGGKCDDKDGNTAGCFLSNAQRQRYLGLFMRDVTVAQTNFKGACTSLQVKELLKKEDDLDWFTSLIMDFASTFLLGAAAKVLKRMRALGADALIEKGVMMIDRGADAKIYDQADKLLRSVTDKRIEAWSKTAFYTVKKVAQGKAKDAKNAPAREDKSDVEAYLNALKNQADIGYSRFVTDALSQADDAEFAVLYEGMQPEYHQQEAYEAALQEKLDAYKTSRVRDIGRKTTKDETGHLLVQRETRVVWVKEPNGDRRLYYQYQQAGVTDFHAPHDDPGKAWAPDWIMRQLPSEFGVIGGQTKIGDPVPDDFVEIALARSEALYGPTETFTRPPPAPQLVVPKLDVKPNPNAPSFQMTNGGSGPMLPSGPGPLPPSGPGPLPPGSVFDPGTSNAPPAGAVDSYPPGSIFNKKKGTP